MGIFKNLITKTLTDAGEQGYDQLDKEVEKRTGWKGGLPTAVDTIVKGGIVVGAALLGAFLSSKIG